MSTIRPTPADGQERPVEKRQSIVGDRSPERRQGSPEASQSAPDDGPEPVEPEPSIQTIIARLPGSTAPGRSGAEQVGKPPPFARSSNSKISSNPSLSKLEQQYSSACYTRLLHKSAPDDPASLSDREEKGGGLSERPKVGRYSIH